MGKQHCICTETSKRHGQVVRPHFQIHKMRFRQIKYFVQVLTFSR